MNRPLTRLSVVALAALLSACASLAPSQGTPAAAIPTQFGQSVAGSVASSTTVDAAQIAWQDFVQEPRLRDTIALALQNNRSLRQAVLAIEQARASYRISDAAQWPTVEAGASVSNSRTPAQATSSGQVQRSRSNSLSVGISAYEVDLFGRVANLKDAALESFLATEQARRSAQISLVAELSQAWLALAADQAQLALARRTLDSQQRTLDLQQQRHALGASSGLSLAQLQTGVEGARRDVAAYEAQVQQDRNALQALVGTEIPAGLLPPETGAAGTAGTAAAVTGLVAVPADLPSSVLQQRPDVLAAEHALRAAAQDIGAARAALYPSIRLTSSLGTASTSLGDLFKGGAWSFVPSISLPIFDGGAARANVSAKEVARDIQLAAYDQTLQTAFREVADALAVRATLDRRLAAQQALVDAAAQALQLAEARQAAGASSALDVLDAQRTLYAAQQGLITLRLTEQGNRVSLFKALGGGWKAA
ncbi:MAG: efflux transporter outer membrane subunit [Burkholderiaceae bacterium]|nr:efflux transporter outer membrane subunit [Burkholderiaceae bacterium]